MKIKNSILKIVYNSADENHFAMEGRIADVDLVSAEAKHHTDCLQTFFLNTKWEKVKEMPGRCAIQDSIESMTKIIQFINENIADCQFLVSDLLTLVKDIKLRIKEWL